MASLRGNATRKRGVLVIRPHFLLWSGSGTCTMPFRSAADWHVTFLLALAGPRLNYVRGQEQNTAVSQPSQSLSASRLKFCSSLKKKKWVKKNQHNRRSAYEIDPPELPICANCF